MLLTSIHIQLDFRAEGALTMRGRGMWNLRLAVSVFVLSRRRRTYDERLRYVELKISSVRVCMSVCLLLFGTLRRLKITLRDRPYLQTNQKPFPKPPSENL